MDNDRAIRPVSFDDFIGQQDTIDNLRVFVASAKVRNEPVDHILFSGPPGLGKTSLANALSNEVGTKIHTVNATTVKNKGDLIAVLSTLDRMDILFIDEIHALTPRVEEVLYTAMEDYSIDIAANGETIKVELEPFTLIGATTVTGLVSKPLLDRFGEVVQLEPYSGEEMSIIVDSSFKKLGLNATKEAANEVASRSRGTPRIANRIVRRVRDFAIAFKSDLVDSGLILRVAKSLGIDSYGLDKSSRSYMICLSKASKPIGVNTIASSINEDEDTVQNTIEPYLIRSGLIAKSVKGRVITDLGAKYLSTLN